MSQSQTERTTGKKLQGKGCGYREVIFFLKFIYLIERERASASEGGTETGRENLNVGLELTNCEILS